MTYPANVVSIPANAALTLGPNFINSPLKSGTNTEAGRIDEAGGTNTITSTGAILVFTQKFVANSVGVVTFATAQAVAPSSASLHTITLNNPTKTADVSEITFGTAQVSVFENLFASNDTFSVAEDSIQQSLNVLANDLPLGVGTITAVGNRDHGGLVTISGERAV